ncbi:MAG TPA: hypothetical protein VK670_01970 [Silvibacterium sp.]|nr:hypothetical protein [Silvibacterium sp.]
MVPQFAKRRNSDGTMDSICLNCFRTVATCTDQLELIEFEKDHRCTLDDTASKQNGGIVSFPPERMIETHRRQQRDSVPLNKVENTRKRIEFRK